MSALAPETPATRTGTNDTAAPPSPAAGAPIASASGDTLAFIAAVLAAAVLLAIIAAPALSGKVYTRGDLVWFHLPTRAFYAECLAAGDSFDWWPDIFCGFYLQGEGQAGMYHPLHFVLYRSLPLAAAFNVEFLLSYPAILAGMYFFLGRWRLPRSARMLGALTFAFSGATVLGFQNMHAIFIIAHLPWLLLAIDIALRSGARRARTWAALAVAALTASQLLLGFPQFVAFSLFVEILYVLFTAPLGLFQIDVTRGRRLLAALPGLLAVAAAKVIGALLAAVQLVPTLDALADSPRLSLPQYQGTHLSLQWPNVLQMAAPHLFAGPFPHVRTDVYCGAATLLLAALLAATLLRPRHLSGPLARVPGESAADRRERFSRRPLEAWALALFLLALLLSLGENGGLAAVAERLPVLSVFRAPSRWMVIVHFALAVCAAAGCARLLEGSCPLPGRRKAALALLAAAPLASAAIVMLARGDDSRLLLGPLGGFARPGAFATFAGPALMLAAGVLILAAARRRPGALAALLLLAAADLALHGLPYLYDSPPRTPASLADDADLPDPGPLRLHMPASSNRATMAGRRLSSGYVALSPRLALDYATTPARRVAGVAYVVGAHPRDRRVTAPLPRARLLAHAVLSTSQARAAFDSGAIDPARTALVDMPVALDPVPDAPGTAVITSDRPGRISVAAHSPARRLLVVSERFHKGWRATVDGRDARVVRVYGDFMGCVVEPGSSEVRLRFEPDSLRRGRTLTGFGAALAVVLAALSFALDGRRRTGPAPGEMI